MIRKDLEKYLLELNFKNERLKFIEGKIFTTADVAISIYQSAIPMDGNIHRKDKTIISFNFTDTGIKYKTMCSEMSYFDIGSVNDIRKFFSKIEINKYLIDNRANKLSKI